MRNSLFSSIFVTLGLFGSLAVACGGGSSGDGGSGGGSSGSSSSSNCAGPSNTGNASAACTQCIEAQCSAPFTAFCEGNCAKSGSSSACQKATRDIASCVADKCLADCSDSVPSNGGSSGNPVPGSAGSGDTNEAGASFGTPTTNNCKTLAACCETLPIKEVRDPCLQAAGYDNDAPCLNLLNSYKAAGECLGGSGTASTFACYIEADGSCTKTPAPDSIKDTLAQSCTSSGGVAGDDCPAADLIGCCTLTGNVESCSYSSAQSPLDKSTCEQSGGTWARKP